ncbi:glycoside hydrolase family 19 protein [Achromobacter animicus]|uniref:glycoside hydrolase family 19 protein n=1 Tax=Achromobacter animicus TaxID=1389935 RepID=UPI0028AC32F1|nr:glycoside hydrolase family 19 protein [Achromobacter animicus]
MMNAHATVSAGRDDFLCKQVTAMLSAEQLQRIFPNCKAPGAWADALAPAFQKYEIETPDRIASFLAQTGYESGQYNRIEENLNYSTAARLTKVWPKRFPDEASAMPYVNNPQGLANLVYANRMGNGDAQSNDGFRYRGRGIIQLTGRSNYDSAGDAMGLNLLETPELLSDPKWAALSAGWYWQSRGLNELADDRTHDDDLEDFARITRRINGGLVGLKDRFALFKQVYAELMR